MSRSGKEFKDRTVQRQKERREKAPIDIRRDQRREERDERKFNRHFRKVA